MHADGQWNKDELKRTLPLYFQSKISCRGATPGGDLRKLNRRTPDPLRERPHMIRQLRGHRRCPLRARTGLERPHRPAEVRAIHREECHRAMDPPILREAIRLPRLPRVSVAVRTVGPLHERDVDGAT